MTTRLITDNLAQAATMTARAVLEGDLSEARRWALEYAAHRDANRTMDEYLTSANVARESQ